MARPRDERQHPDGGRPDHRTPGQRDRDRIIHTLAFRRLAFVTQVVGPHEGHVFHNRLTHSVEVAQIARRLAEKFRGQATEATSSQIDPDVVEAAGLAHDLGHPPFGHIAERCLSTLVRDHTCLDGFEGNAQTFRILTRLAAHRLPYVGLNLTRATLNATLKYPWACDPNDSHRSAKFSAYDDDTASLQFVRDENDDALTLEAEIMDFADDLAYSVHDFDDFYRAGLIPLEMLLPVRDRNGELGDTEEYKRVVGSWVTAGKVSEQEANGSRGSLHRLLDLLRSDSRYEGTFVQRAERRTSTATLIGEYVAEAALDEGADPGKRLRISPDRARALSFLRWLLWYYVINHPRLATQQHGQKTIIELLFRKYFGAIQGKEFDLIPPMFRDLAQNVGGEKATARLAADIVASFTDSQAETMYRRLIGVQSGSIVDLLER